MKAGRFGILATALAVLVGCASARTTPSDPLSAEEHNDLGVAYHGGGQYTLAVREFRRAVARRPGWARALVNLGDAHIALGEVEAAIEAYEAALRATPDDPGATNNLAWALLQHPRRWPEAERLIRAALGRNPEPRAYYLDTLGLALLKRGAPRDALEAFRAALADPGLSDAATRALVVGHAADALGALGDLAGAERCRLLARRLGESGAGVGGAGNEIGDREPMC